MITTFQREQKYDSKHLIGETKTYTPKLDPNQNSQNFMYIDSNPLPKSTSSCTLIKDWGLKDYTRIHIATGLWFDKKIHSKPYDGISHNSCSISYDFVKEIKGVTELIDKAEINKGLGTAVIEQKQLKNIIVSNSDKSKSTQIQKDL